LTHNYEQSLIYMQNKNLGRGTIKIKLRLDFAKVCILKNFPIIGYLMLPLILFAVLGLVIMSYCASVVN